MQNESQKIYIGLYGLRCKEIVGLKRDPIFQVRRECLLTSSNKVGEILYHEIEFRVFLRESDAHMAPKSRRPEKTSLAPRSESKSVYRNTHVDNSSVTKLSPGIAVNKMAHMVAICARQGFHSLCKPFNALGIVGQAMEYWKLSIESKVPARVDLLFRGTKLLSRLHHTLQRQGRNLPRYTLPS